MKLLIIVLCLISERFLVHVSSHQRLHWFSSYGQVMEKRIANISLLSSPWLMLVFAIMPMLIITFFVFHFFDNSLFGLVGLVLNVIVFYCCIGPGNPFYPANEEDIATYFTNMNEKIFAVLFWYIILGPIAALAYRLISLSQNQQIVGDKATKLTQLLDWLPARMTALLYLMVGNFQAGFGYFSQNFLTAPENNNVLLATCGMQALGSGGGMPQAEALAEHAMIALLVLIACFTIVAWM